MLFFVLSSFSGNDAKNSWCFFEKFVLNYCRKAEEETGSAEEQPVSNRSYGYTVNRKKEGGAHAPLSVYWHPVMAKKTYSHCF